MFQQKTNTSSNNTQPTSSGTGDFTIYSMKKDLKNINNPNLNIDSFQETLLQKDLSKKTTAQEKNNPFLSSDIQNKNIFPKKIIPIKPSAKPIMQNISIPITSITNDQKLVDSNKVDNKSFLNNFFTPKKDQPKETPQKPKEIFISNLSNSHNDKTIIPPGKESNEIKITPKNNFLPPKEFAINPIINKNEIELKKINEKKVQLENELSQKEKELNEKKINIQNAENQLNEIQRKKQEIGKNTTTKISITQEKGDNFSAIKDVIQKELEILDRQLAERKQSLDFTKQEEQDFNKRKGALRNEITQKEKELNEKKISIQDIESHLKETLNKKYTLDEIVKKEENSIREKDEKIFFAQKELEKLNNQLEERKKLLDFSRQEEQVFNEKKVLLKNELTQKEQELNEKKETIQKIDSQLKEISDKKNLLDKTLIREELIIKEKEEEISFAQKELERLSNQLKEKNGNVLNLNSKINVSNENNPGNLTKLKNEISQAEAQLKEILRKKQETEAYITKEEARINEEKKYFASIIQKENSATETTPQSNQELAFHTMREDINNITLDKSVSSLKKGSSQQKVSSSKEETWTNTQDDTIKNNSVKKVIFSIAIIFVILIFGVGGYWFWMTREMNNNKETNLPPEELTNLNSESPQDLAVFSTDRPNYLLVDSDISTIDESILRQTLDDYSIRASQMRQGSLIEFILTDKANNPIPFQFFAEKIGLKLSPEILSQVGSDFSLYIYNYGDKRRFGLSLTIKNTPALSEALDKDETAFINGLTPIFSSNTTYTLPTEGFGEASYNGVIVKYLNITDPEDLAIDYSITNDRLIIGTTKTSFFSILDRQINNSLLLN